MNSENLKSKVVTHAAGILLVGFMFALVIFLVEAQQARQGRSIESIQKYFSLERMDFGNPVDRAIFRESLELFYPGQGERNDSLMRQIDALRQRQFTDANYRTGNHGSGLTWSTLEKLGGMYLKFFVVYAVVLAVIYLAALRIAVFRFVKMKQNRESYLAEAVESMKQLAGVAKARKGKIFKSATISGLKAVVKGAALAVFFSPGYVIAYSLKTSLDSSSLLFMVLLGIISNGVLIQASNKFFTILAAENRKGYVKTAIVKNLHASYEWNLPEGIPMRSLLRIREGFRSHIFRHVFLNARFQFIPALKECGLFLVTGLIIIEMALNIQGHLCYELMQHILFRRYAIAGAIIFGIFLTVKATEIIVDIWHDRERRKYGY